MSHSDSSSLPLVAGVETAGAACGIKPAGRPDLALWHFPDGARWAATVTNHQLRAAPVRRLEALRSASPRPLLRAIVVNSGNANACTGHSGMAAAESVATAAARELGCDPSQVLTCSTGVIGVPLPDDRICAALPDLVGALDPAGWARASAAIMTTDNGPKTAWREIGGVRIVGIAKGAGMIAPNMATMLAYVCTDADLDEATLDDMLAAAVDASFNRIIVDGDQSTNDTVVLAATGKVAVRDRGAVAQAIREVCLELALMIVRDGEGARRIGRITVEGAPNDADALRIARTIGLSPLVKTALYGGDPNWGRIAAAAGNAGVPLDEFDLVIEVGGEVLYRNGDNCMTADVEARAAAAMAQDEVPIRVVVGNGSGTATIWASDLGHEYVTCNADYRS
ncbi:MAG: bifunctional glutamate N-acetyltransferase/amino-acid acetyltransferase ArgJ [Candidatus Dadabacteria bacterium]|nr:MAG: bifunctional glutamate N-acetyltransferase/amino-acid acetyltransferase ArgJ [Candidatus Dadabacteria bacterium]